LIDSALLRTVKMSVSAARIYNEAIL